MRILNLFQKIFQRNTSKQYKRRPPSIKDLIDRRNSSLWNDLSQEFEIEVRFQDSREYRIYTEGKLSIIYASNLDVNPGAFTHELLHLFIMKQGVFIGDLICEKSKEYHNLAKRLPLRLFEHIANCVDHIKMLPIYKELGFHLKDFILDFNENKFTDQELNKIQSLFTQGSKGIQIVKSLGVEHYIARYFAIKACPNPEFRSNYNTKLIDLKSIDQKLFSILENFTMSWDQFDVLSKDSLKVGYYMFTLKFLGDLDEWIGNRNVV